MKKIVSNLYDYLLKGVSRSHVESLFNLVGRLPFKLVLYSFITILLLFLMVGCSTKKAGFFNKFYHNTTTHYNVWWNGNESIKEAQKLLNQNVKDDYSNIVPVYKLGTSQDAITIAPQLDRAFEKGTKGIKKHSININGKEHVHYIAHCYLLLIKSQFYKQEYGSTAFTSQYFISQFKNTKEAYEGMIWYARSMTYQNEYASAETMLDKIKYDISEKAAPSSLEALLYPAYAECAINQEKYKVAADYLKLSIEVVKDKQFKARLYFILGQIYQNQEKLSTASKYYELSLKQNADHQMLFNARMNMAVCYTENKGSNEEVIHILQKMLKDKINAEYKDQIYYAIGEVYMTAKNADLACENWVKSVAAATANKPQKIKSALRLADTYADLYQEYVPAYQYYDTVVSTMTPESKGYVRIQDKYKVLKSLAENIQTINRADSLLAYAELPEQERNKLIDEIIVERKLHDEQKKEEELIELATQAVKAQSNTLKGNWYFYNESTLKQGKEAFVKLFGNRLLADNWFMAKNQGMALSIPMSTPQQQEEEEEEEIVEEGMDDEVEKPESEEKINDPYNRAYYLKDVPKTKQDKQLLHDQIAKSLLLLGFIYDEGIQNEEKALAALHRLVENYQSTEYALPAFYQLYKIYERIGNTPNANYYRNVLLKGFPESDYAHILRDKDYYQEILEREKKAEKAYAVIYKEYQKRNYQNVLVLTKEALNEFNDPELIPKYKYWEALAYGKSGNKEQMFSQFDSIIQNHPESEIIPIIKNQQELLKGRMAQSFFNENEQKDSIMDEKLSNTTVETITTDTLRTISKNDNEKDNSVLSPETDLYRFRENIEHFVIILVDDKKINATQLSYAISDFNTIYFSTAKLKTKVLLFSKELEMVSIEKFTSGKKAMEYYAFMQQSVSPMNEYDTKDYTILVISIQNYMTLYNQKNIQAYTQFFRKFYF